MPVVSAVVLAALLLAAAYASPLALLFAVAVVQLLLAIEWHRAMDVPGAGGGAALALIAGIASAVVAYRGADAQPVTAAAGVLGAATVGVLVHQLVRPRRFRVMASMSGTATLLVLTTLSAFYLTAHDAEARVVVAAVVLAVAGGRAVGALRLGRGAEAAISLAVGFAIGFAAAGVTGTDVAAPALAGTAAGVAGHVGNMLASLVRQPRPWLAGAVGLALGGPVVFVVTRLMAS